MSNTLKEEILVLQGIMSGFIDKSEERHKITQKQLEKQGNRIDKHMDIEEGKFEKIFKAIFGIKDFIITQNTIQDEKYEEKFVTKIEFNPVKNIVKIMTTKFFLLLVGMILFLVSIIGWFIIKYVII